MTDEHRMAVAVKAALAGATVFCGLVAGAGTAVADPEAPAPVPGAPDAVPGAPDAGPPAPPPMGPPTVPEIANPVYGSGNYGSGPIGTLRDLWHQAHDPMDLEGLQDPTGMSPNSVAPPPGAGPAPPLPPGYRSINAPGSETPVTEPAPGAGPGAPGPALPPGYYPLNGPPPPGYEFQPVTAPGAPQAPAGPAAAPTP